MPRFPWISNLPAPLHAPSVEKRPALGRYVLHHLPVVIVIFLVTLVGEHFGMFRRFETFSLDALLNLHAPPAAAPIFLVVIDNDDYEKHFDGMSPLKPEVIREALQAIERGRPAVVAVDLDTSGETFAEGAWPNAVWMRSATPGDENSTTALEHVYSADALEEITRGLFLGGQFKESLEGNDDVIHTTPASGAALFLADSDGVFRRYKHLFYSPDANPPSETRGFVESLPWAICRAYASFLRASGRDKAAACIRVDDEERHPIAKRAEEIILTFGESRDRFRVLNLSSLLAAAGESYWETNSPLKDAIVLFGGTFAASRDVFFTPVGPRHGIELVAHAVETSLANGGIREFNHHLAHGLDIVVGLVILLLLWRFPGHHAFIGTLLVAAALALAASFLAFRSFAYWFNFAPMVVGLWLHFQWEKRQEQHKMRGELKALREELSRLKQ